MAGQVCSLPACLPLNPSPSLRSRGPWVGDLTLSKWWPQAHRYSGDLKLLYLYTATSHTGIHCPGTVRTTLTPWWPATVSPVSQESSDLVGWVCRLRTMNVKYLAQCAKSRSSRDAVVMSRTGAWLPLPSRWG